MTIKKENLLRKILVVDDQKGIRTLLYEIFKKSSYKVLLAKNHREAVDLAVKEKPDLAIIDLNLPRENGITTYKTITREVPDMNVIFMTAYGDEADIEEIPKKQSCSCVSKPFDILELKALVEKKLNNG